jgi:cell wall-associated NlpC family hydrolase
MSRTRYRRRGEIPAWAQAAGAFVAVSAVLGAGGRTIAHAGVHHTPPGHHATQPAPPAAARAIAYARAQLGKPYCWGGTGASCPNPPYTGYDCSGLVMMAWQAAGVGILRTSEQQWASLRHIPLSAARPGDLVFYAGSDGTLTAPGHVVLYIGHGRVIQAYATGWPVMVSTLASLGSSHFVGVARVGA